MSVSKKYFQRQTLLSLYGLIMFTSSFSQSEGRVFKLEDPYLRISNSKYSSVGFLDTRNDTSDFGFVCPGSENIKRNVIIKASLAEQLTSILKNCLDTNCEKKTLIFQLRKFKFIEYSNSISEVGLSLVRVSLYTKTGTTYYPLANLDTIIALEEPEATQPLFKRTSVSLTTFLLKNLSTVPPINSQGYSIRQILLIDSVEKSNTPLFTATQYNNGIYSTFQSFKNQKPEYVLREIRKRKGRVTTLITDSKLKISPTQCYAYVFNNVPYISAEYGCYPLVKKDGDFYFAGKVPVNADAAYVAMAHSLGRAVGGLAGSNCIEHV